MAPIKNDFAQGTIEYLVVIGIIVVVGLLIVGISATLFESPSERVSSGTNKLGGYIQSGISVLDMALDTDGNAIISLQNTSAEPLTITQITLNGKDNNYTPQPIPFGTQENFFLNSSSLCTCEAGQSKASCELKIFFTSSEGLNKSVTYNLNIDCVSEVVNNTSTILPQDNPPAGPYNFAAKADGNTNDIIMGVDIEGDSNVYVTTFTYAFSERAQITYGNYSFDFSAPYGGFTMGKFSIDSNEWIWAREINNGAENGGPDPLEVISHNDGVYVFGKRTDLNSVIMRLNKDTGETEWELPITGGVTQIYSAYFGNDGNIYVSGISPVDTTISFGNISFVQPFLWWENYYFVAKAIPNGDWVWAVNGVGGLGTSTITETEDGNIFYVTDVNTGKLSGRTGELFWSDARSFNQHATYSCTTQDNNIFVSVTQMDSQLIMKKISPLGTDLQTINDSQGNNLVFATGKLTCNGNKVTLAGLFADTINLGDYQLNTSLSYLGFRAEFDSDLNAWTEAETLSTDLSQIMYYKELNDGNTLIAGDFTSTEDFNTTSLTSTGGQDIFIWKRKTQ